LPEVVGCGFESALGGGFLGSGTARKDIPTPGDTVESYFQHRSSSPALGGLLSNGSLRLFRFRAVAVIPISEPIFDNEEFSGERLQAIENSARGAVVEVLSLVEDEARGGF